MVVRLKKKKFDADLYRKLKEESFVILDIETTGRHPESHSKIIEIGALKVVKGKFVEQFSTLINPELSISSTITEITKITNEMVEDSPVYEEVLPHLFSFIGDAVVVCHNTPFDWDRFLLYYFKRLGIFPTNETLDTMKLFKLVYPESSKKNLKVMTETMNVSLEGHHRAVNDALATAKCFLQLRATLLNQMEQAFPQEVEQVVPLEKEWIPLFPTRKTVVVSANYWEKELNKKTTYRRIYVSLREGEVFGRLYYDCNTQRWYNEDFPYNLNFLWVEHLVAQKMNVAKIEDVSKQSKVS